MKTISIVIPTVDGRQEHLERCIDGYLSTTAEYRTELLIIDNEPTCGQAWNKGADLAKGDYLHFTADDLEPQEGWHKRALPVADAGFLPAPRILGPNGQFESCGGGTEAPEGAYTNFTRIPFMSMRQWEFIGPSLNCHYYTDNYISWRGREMGYETIVVRSYLFKHYWAQEGRGAGMAENKRMAHDYKIFMKAIS